MATKNLKISILDIRHFSFTATIIVVLSLSFLLSFRRIQSSKLDLLLITPALHEKPIFGQTRFIIKNQAPSFFRSYSLGKKTKKFNGKLRKIQDKIAI